MDHGLDMDFKVLLAIHDLNLADNAAVIFPNVPFKRFARRCLLRGLNLVNRIEMNACFIVFRLKCGGLYTSDGYVSGTCARVQGLYIPPINPASSHKYIASAAVLTPNCRV